MTSSSSGPQSPREPYGPSGRPWGADNVRWGAWWWIIIALIAILLLFWAFGRGWQGGASAPTVAPPPTAPPAPQAPAGSPTPQNPAPERTPPEPTP